MTVLVFDTKVCYYDKNLNMLKERHVRSAVSPYIQRIGVFREGFNSDEMDNIMIASEVKPEQY